MRGLNDAFVKRFKEPGPVAAAFLNSAAEICGIMGPQGGGKTSAAIMKQLKYSVLMPPCRDGWRRCRSIAIRETYRQLWQTTIPDWQEWIRPDAGEWVGGKDQPARHTLMFDIPAVGKLMFQIDFVALGEGTIEATMRGFKPTIAWLNEADTLPEGALEYVFGRLARYPQIEELIPGAELIPLLVCDFNAPEPGNHVERFFIDAETRPKNVAFFRQPGGRSPKAENLAHLPAGYYARQLETWKNRRDLIRRLIDNEIGYSRDGKPVYEEVNQDFHFAESELLPDPRRPIVIGADAGRHPALVICQENALGQLLVLDELYLGGGIGAQKFGKALNELLEERYSDCEIDEEDCVCDPTAGNPTQDTRENEAGDKETWIEIMRDVTAIDFKPSQCGNNLALRIEAGRSRFTETLDGQPSVLISPRCPKLRKALVSGYRFRKRQGLNPGHTYEATPEKNDSSHVVEGWQYLCFRIQRGYALETRKRRGRHTREETSHDPLAA